MPQTYQRSRRGGDCISVFFETDGEARVERDRHRRCGLSQAAHCALAMMGWLDRTTLASVRGRGVAEDGGGQELGLLWQGQLDEHAGAGGLTSLTGALGVEEDGVAPPGIELVAPPSRHSESGLGETLSPRVGFDHEVRNQRPSSSVLDCDACHRRETVHGFCVLTTVPSGVVGRCTICT